MAREPAGALGQQKYFVDSNVLLRVGQPDIGWLYQQSVSFLKKHRGDLVIGPLVYEEVDYQLRRHHGQYQAIADVRHWLYRGCDMIDLTDEDRRLISLLTGAYAREGWDGVAGDEGDRVHAATASVGHAAFLVTWERRFIEQAGLIERVNRTHGITFAPRLLRPDWT